MPENTPTYEELLKERNSLRERVSQLETQNQTAEKRLLQSFDEIGQTLLNTLDLNIIVDELCKQIVQFGIFRSLMVALVDTSQNKITVVRRLSRQTEKGLVEYKSAIADGYLNKNETIVYSLNSPNITAEVARTGKLTIIEGWDDRFTPNTSVKAVPSIAPEYRSEYTDRISYFIPIKNNTAVQAVLATGSDKKSRSATESMITAMQPLLNLASVALQHAQLYQTIKHQATSLETEVQKRTHELEQQIQQQNLLVSISQAVQQMTTPNDLLNVITTTYHGLRQVGVNIKALTIHSVTNQKTQSFRAYRITPTGPKTSRPKTEPTAFQSWKNAKTVYRKNIAIEQNGLPPNYQQGTYKTYGFIAQSMLTIPYAQGILVFLSDTTHAFSDSDIAFGEEITNMLSLGIARLEDLEQLEIHTKKLETEITERKQIQAEIRASEQRYRNLIEDQTEFIVRWRPDGTRTFVNQSYCRYYGISAEEAIGTSFFPYISNADMENVKARIAKLSIENPVSTGEHQIFRTNGQTGWNEWTDRAFFDKSGNIIEYQSIGRDITERKQAETQRQELITQLEAQNAELERFTYTVSHDLKSPLITIRGFIDQVEKNAKEGNTTRLETDLKFIRDASNKMEHLLNDLLELSRIGRLTNPSEHIPLTELTHDVCNLLAGTIQTNNVHIQINPHLPTVYGDRTRLSEVLQNLIENAIKFMGNQTKPHIEIGKRTNNDQTILYVKDNGMGIDPQYHSKVFNLFDRLETNTEGTGIGLALVKRIIEHHNGQIWIESKGQNQGTTVLFTLPQQ